MDKSPCSATDFLGSHSILIDRYGLLDQKDEIDAIVAIYLIISDEDW